MNKNLQLFSSEQEPNAAHAPLAERVRPLSWEDYQWLQEVDPDLRQYLEKGEGLPPSLILWGPPGCGKTTLAKLIGSSFDVHFVQFSAVLGGVKEVREIVEQAKLRSKATLLFVDEIHRFNKAQQDAFLPHVESGTIILVGATTENPSFTVNSALLSRSRVLVLPPLTVPALSSILVRAARELGDKIESRALEVIASAAQGDARQALNILESAHQVFEKDSAIKADQVTDLIKNQGHYHYDRSGEEHYNLISAFIKSMRGSNPDAALYWGFRMLESGEDPRFLIRRLVIFASEDIGNADPRALQLAVATSDAFEKLGLPEGRIPIAQCITYLASAPKSNRSYSAMHEAVAAVKEYPRAQVPKHLRNAPTKLMKDEGYGLGYDYPHNCPDGYAPNVDYLPSELKASKFYEPSTHGIERSIKERLEYFRSLDKGSG